MITDNITGDVSGHITGVSLSSFLQMIEMEQKTCTIKVFAKKNLGHIFFVNGVLIDADTIRLKHLDALYDILSWNDIVLEVEKNVLKKPNHINLPLMHILIESAQHADEIQRTDPPKNPKSKPSPSTNDIPLQILNNRNFCLEIGIKLLIDFDDLVVPFRSSLVGIEEGKYLILKAPGPIGRIDHDLFKVENLIVKSLYKGTIYAFRSKVINIVSKPSKLMFIAYPQEIEHHELRSHKRFKCNIATQSTADKQEKNGVIKNISKGGCLCVIETSSADEHLPHELLNATISFKCHFPGSSKQVNFMGEVRNKMKKSNETGVGIKFIYPDSSNEARTIINDYIRLIEYSSENV
jgi:c-di-GMP-binding flagellar brake protein YcgR